MHIGRFRGQYAWLSNMYECEITIEDITYPSAENAFVAMKTLNIHERIKIAGMKPPDAKKYGRKLQLRVDWNLIKLDLMHQIILAKFSDNPKLKQYLLATGDATIEEGNTWGDDFWGVYQGSGRNHLGKIIMQVREELKTL